MEKFDELDFIIQDLINEQDVPPPGLLNEALMSEKDPEKYPKNYAVIVAHYRGKSAHLDFRRKQNGYLEGETMMNAPEGLIDEDVDTLEKAKKWTDVLLQKGKFTPEMDPNKKVVIVPKSKQPLVWLNVRDVAYPPGSVGATRFEWGVFSLMDDGMVYPGVQKPWFKEFFLNMGKFKGRMVERLLGVGGEWTEKPKEELQWQAWFNMVDQTPYILSERGRKKKDYVPKEGESCLPPEWEARIPADLKWWIPGLNETEKMNRLDKAYNLMVSKGFVKGKTIQEDAFQEARVRFTLREHWWRGQKVIRDMRVLHWDLVIDSGKGYLDEWNLLANPLDYSKPIAANRKICKQKTPLGEDNSRWLEFEGSIPPEGAQLKKGVVAAITAGGIQVKLDSGAEILAKQPEISVKPGQVVWIDDIEQLYTAPRGGAVLGNPNARIPAYFRILDTGEAEWIEDNPDFASFNFIGKNLKGYWILKRESPEADIWFMAKAALPGEMKTALDLGKEQFPIMILYGNKKYTLIKTRQDKLLLGRIE